MTSGAKSNPTKKILTTNSWTCEAATVIARGYCGRRIPQSVLEDIRGHIARVIGLPVVGMVTINPLIFQFAGRVLYSFLA